MATGPAEQRCGGTSRRQVGRERSPPAQKATNAAPIVASPSASTLPSSPEGAAPTLRNTPPLQRRTGASHRTALDAVIPDAQRTSAGAPDLIPGPSCHLLRTTLITLNRHEWCADHLRTPALALVEAAGIEPASEKVRTRASTRLAGSFFYLASEPLNGKWIGDQPARFAPRLRASPESYPALSSPR